VREETHHIVTTGGREHRLSEGCESRASRVGEGLDRVDDLLAVGGGVDNEAGVLDVSHESQATALFGSSEASSCQQISSTFLLCRLVFAAAVHDDADRDTLSDNQNDSSKIRKILPHSMRCGQPL
jgi:hypothetical protein